MRVGDARRPAGGPPGLETACQPQSHPPPIWSRPDSGREAAARCLCPGLGGRAGNRGRRGGGGGGAGEGGREGAGEGSVDSGGPDAGGGGGGRARARARGAGPTHQPTRRPPPPIAPCWVQVFETSRGGGPAAARYWRGPEGRGSLPPPLTHTSATKSALGGIREIWWIPGGRDVPRCPNSYSSPPLCRKLVSRPPSLPAAPSARPPSHPLTRPVSPPVRLPSLPSPSLPPSRAPARPFSFPHVLPSVLARPHGRRGRAAAALGRTERTRAGSQVTGLGVPGRADRLGPVGECCRDGRGSRAVLPSTGRPRSESRASGRQS